MVFNFATAYSYQGKKVVYLGDNVFKSFKYADSDDYFYIEPEQESLVTEWEGTNTAIEPAKTAADQTQEKVPTTRSKSK